MYICGCRFGYMAATAYEVLYGVSCRLCIGWPVGLSSYPAVLHSSSYNHPVSGGSRLKFDGQRSNHILLNFVSSLVE